jgi:hypothetical protein
VFARRIDDASNTALTYQAQADESRRVPDRWFARGSVHRVGIQRAARRARHAWSRTHRGLDSRSAACLVPQETSKRIVEARAGQEAADVDFTVASPQDPPQATARCRSIPQSHGERAGSDQWQGRHACRSASRWSDGHGLR